MIELLVVIALTAVLATISFVSIGGYRNENHLKDEGSKVAAALQNVHDNSVSQLNGKRWGMRFTNGTSSDTYQQFSGTSFASGTPGAAYALGYNLAFGNPATSSEDIIFNPITGALPSDATVNIIPNPANGMAENIIVNTLGQITTRFETGLVGYWPMDEGTGTTAYDASGYGYNGTLVNGPTWQFGTSCKVGDCLSFNGSNNYISLPSGTYFSGPFTITSWVYVRSYNNWSRLLDFGNGAGSDNVLFAISQGTSGDAYLESWNGGTRGFSLSSGAPLPLNQWVFLVGEANGQNATIYLNGQPWVTMATTFTATNVTRTMNYIAQSNWSADSYANASFDDIRIYNRALSAQEIQDLYNAY